MSNRELAAEQPGLIPHGDYLGWKTWGCRCGECRDAWADWIRDYRKRRKAETGERIVRGRFVS